MLLGVLILSAGMSACGLQIIKGCGSGRLEGSFLVLMWQECQKLADSILCTPIKSFLDPSGQPDLA